MARFLTIFIVVVTLGYSAYWWAGSAAQETAWARWMEERRAAGWVADYDALEVKGYPNRFDTRLTGFTIADPRAGWAWSGPVFQVLALSYKPNHIIAVWPLRSLASLSAPAASNASTGSSLPVRAAVINTVSPPRSVVFGSAPALRSALTISPLPFVHAIDSGRTP